MDDRGPWIGHLTKPVQVCACNEGWRCEEHPDWGWPHDDCPGPGVPCAVCNSESPPRLPADWESKANTDA